MRVVVARRSPLALLLMTGSLLISAPHPAVAECTNPVIPMPSFTAVAPTAERIYVGTVIEEVGLQPGEEPGLTASFVLDVDEVLRGPVPEDPLLVENLRTGARPVGECVLPFVYVRVGDRVAFAIRGVLPETGRRGSAVAWIDGAPDAIFASKAEVLTLSRVRRLAATLPDTSTAEVRTVRVERDDSFAITSGLSQLGQWLRDAITSIISPGTSG